MRKLATSLLIATAALCAFSSAQAQNPAPKRGSANGTGSWSAHETTSTKIDNNRVVLVYGRPTAKDPKTGEDRTIWGGKLVPFGKIWRLGSDEATLLVTEKDITLGGVALAGGAYTLFLLPAADGSAKLLVNKHVGQWGIDPYDEKSELARIDLTRTELPAMVEQFTMAVKKDAAGGGVLSLSWGNLQYSAPYAVKK